MKLYHITWKNIKERPAKIALLVVTLAIGVATVASLYSIVRAMSVDLQDKIDEYGANMVIVPKSKSLPLSYAGVTVGGLTYRSALLSGADVAKIRTIKNSANIATVAPKLLGIVPVNGHKATLAGVRFADEFKLKKWWAIKQGARPVSADDALLGGKAAHVLNVKAGDTITIKNTQFKVKGILSRVGSQEDELVYIDLKRAQTLLGKPGQVSLIEVAAWCKNCPITDMQEQLSEKLTSAKVSAVRQATQTRDAVVGRFMLFSVILSTTMATIAFLIVFTNMLSAVRERRREIGIMRAVGYRKAHVLYIILLESGAAGLVAGITGYTIGFVTSNIIAPFAVGIDVGIAFDPLFAILAAGSTALIAIVASIYPAVVASRLSPAEAINTI
ncbi:MAG TPA: FtsX-like permease family protein [Candidatus Aquicultor sp.]|jgi:putative ABC transport system permease protein